MVLPDTEHAHQFRFAQRIENVNNLESCEIKREPIETQATVAVILSLDVVMQV